jgi:cell division topological specificity factor
MTIPIISDLLERLFGPGDDPHSRDDVKRRLRIVLAHDRLALDPQTLEMMRQEIIAVVSRYVEVDYESLEFSLATNERVTALTANLPIRRIRPQGRGPDQPISAEDEVEKIELASAAEASALDARDTEAALKRFAETNRDAHPYLDIDRDIDRDTERSDSREEEAADSVLDDNITQAEFAEMSSDDESTAGSMDDEAADEPTPDVPDMSIADASASIVRKSNQKKI